MKTIRATLAIAATGLLLAACSTAGTGAGGTSDEQQPQGESELVETTDLDIAGGWVLGDNQDITLEITKTGQASGSGGCNSYNTTIGRDPATDALVVGPVVSTRMACDEAVMNAESEYFAQLEAVVAGSVDGATLTLTTTDDDSLIFTAAG